MNIFVIVDCMLGLVQYMKASRLLNELLKQGYIMERLNSSLMLYGRYGDNNMKASEF